MEGKPTVCGTWEGVGEELQNGRTMGLKKGSLYGTRNVESGSCTTEGLVERGKKGNVRRRGGLNCSLGGGRIMWYGTEDGKGMLQ